MMKDAYYAGILAINDWEVNEHGLHKPMITKDEYETNLALANGRKVRQKLKYNPDFKLNLALHEPCTDREGKLCGINHTNGKGWYRKEYVCRNCKKRVPQAKVHESMGNLLRSMVAKENGLNELKKALRRVWNNNESYRVDRAKQLEMRKEALQEQKSELLRSLSANPEIADDIKEEVVRIKAQIVEVDKQLAEDSDIDKEFAEFAAYALDYTEDLRSRWWDLPGKQLDECKQLLFRHEIIVKPDGNVYTPQISTIYSLLKTKPSMKAGKNVEMVELAGTAPASIGLSLVDRLQV